AVAQHRRGGLLGGGAGRGRLGLGGRPQLVGIGVEAEHDLRLALGHARGEGVAETALQAQLPLAALFKALPAVKRGTREAAMWMRSPVRGLTPWRAARSETPNLPNPVTVTSRPRRSASSTVSMMASTARPASALVSAARSATWSTSSDFFTSSSSFLIGNLTLTPHADGRLATMSAWA